MADEKKNEPDEKELDELEEEIEHARRDSDEAVHGSFYEGDHPMYEESGAEAREDDSDTGVDSKSDDQNIAPG
jgi:hypothetical protein